MGVERVSAISLTPVCPYVPHVGFVSGLVSEANVTYRLFSLAHIEVDKLLSPLRAFPPTWKEKNVLLGFNRRLK